MATGSLGILDSFDGCDNAIGGALVKVAAGYPSVGFGPVRARELRASSLLAAFALLPPAGPIVCKVIGRVLPSPKCPSALALGPMRV